MRLASSVISSVAVFCFFFGFEHQTMEIVDISEKCCFFFFLCDGYKLAESQKPPGFLSIGADEGVYIS